MSIRKKYYALFGLEENASNDELKKAYRKLAMQYHPDRNPDPKAQQVFVDLAEAYEILISDKLPKEKVKKERNEKTFEERREEAKIRFQKQQEREKQEQEVYFSSLTNGRKWKIFRRFAQLSACISFLLILDYFLPKHIENHKITAYSYIYNGLSGGNTICLKTDQDLEFFIKEPFASMYTSHPEITIFRSWIFHNPTKVLHDTGFYNKSFDIDFSVISMFPIIPILFLIPILTVYFRRKSFWFTLFYIFSFNIVGVCFIYFLFYQDRWLHLLTLGFL